MANVASILIYSLPMPTSANRLFIPKPDGTWTKTPQYKAWRDEAGWMLFEQGHKRGRQIHGEFTLSIELRKADRKRRDLDNRLKAICDVLVECGVVQDDSLMIDLHMRWVADGPPCRVMISATATGATASGVGDRG